MTLIISVFWWDEDRRTAGVLVQDGRTTWADVYTFDEMFERCAIDNGEERGKMTRFKLREFLFERALVIIEKGEHRYTSATL